MMDVEGTGNRGGEGQDFENKTAFSLASGEVTGSLPYGKVADVYLTDPQQVGFCQCVTVRLLEN